MQHLMVQPHPLHEHVRIEVSDGQTLLQMLQECAGTENLRHDMTVSIGGREVPRKLWAHVRPKAGVMVHVTVHSLHGSSAKRILLTIAVVVAAFYTGGLAAAAWGTTAGALVTAGVMIAGQLLIDALAPLEMPGGGAGGGSQQWNQLTGSQNQINPWGVIPLVCGDHQYFPPHAAVPYSEYVGESVYQYCLFDLGYLNPGAVVEDIKIGETDISEFEDVQYEITTTPTLYQNDNTELAVNATLDDGEDAVRTTASDAERIVVNLTMPQGLIRYTDKGKERELGAWFQVRWRPTGTGTWFGLPLDTSYANCYRDPGSGQILVKKKSKAPFSFGVAWDVDQGQYDVEVKRFNDTGGDGTRISTSTWATLRSLRFVAPSTTGTMKLAMRIRASDQINGTLQQLSCYVKNTYRQYDPELGTWSGYALSSNPAWVCLDLLTASPAVQAALPDSMLDGHRWEDFAQWCDENALTCRAVLDTGAPLWEVLTKLLRPCMASMDYVNGKYSVVWDRAETVPTAHLTALELRNVQCVRPYALIPHALRVQFINPGIDWKNDEIVVVRDGYSYKGLNARGFPSAEPPATEFETLDLQQAMTPQQAWAFARYHFAQALFRPNMYEFETDIAGLGITRGQLITLGHPVPGFAVGAARVVLQDANVPDGAAGNRRVKLDAVIDTDPSASYTMRFRNADGTAYTRAIQPHAARTDTFYYNIPVPDLAYGDAVVITRDEVADAAVIVTRKSVSGTELTCRFIAVNYSADVLAYWQNPPVLIISELTGERFVRPRRPRIIGILSATDNDSADDALVKRVTAWLNIKSPPSSTAFPQPEFYETRFRVPSVHNLLGDEWSQITNYVDELTTSSEPPVAKVLAGAFDDAEIVQDAGAFFGYEYHFVLNGTATSTSRVAFGTSAVDYNTPIAPGRYIVSFFGRASVAGHNVRAAVQENSTGAFSFTADIPLSTARERVSGILNVTAPGATLGILSLQLYRSTNPGVEVWLDGLMIELQNDTGITEPAPFVVGDTGPQPSEWTTVRTNAADIVEIGGLVRGAPYQFQIRAIGTTRMASNWSTSVTLIVPDTNRSGSAGLPPNTAIKAGVWDVNTQVTYSTTDASATINVSVGTLVISDLIINYAASSVVVSGAPDAQKRFWLYYVDSRLEGGVRTLFATESYTEAIGGLGNIIITPIDITFPSSGGSGGGSGGVGGGGANPPNYGEYQLQ